MFSSVQAVLLFDVNCFNDKWSSESELEQNVAKLKLGTLKLLTEFGAQTEKGIESLRWSFKYYHSLSYKPNTNRKTFVDFNRSSFEEFDNSINDCFCDAFDKKQGEKDQSESQSLLPTNNKSHSFILKKALQEILLDYNWDGPDISSPVKTKTTTGRRSKTSSSKILPENLGPYNTVIVFTNVPQNLESLREFVKECSSDIGTRSKNATRSNVNKAGNITAEDYLGTLLDPATLKSFQEDKIQLNFVAVNSANEIFEGNNGTKIYPVIHSGLGKIGGGLHFINNIVETSSLEIEDDCKGEIEEQVFSSTSPLKSILIRTPWWKKTKGSRPRRPQRGPTLIWEDVEGISNIQVELEVLAVHGSSSRSWGNASVVAVLRSSSLSLLAMAGGKGHLYVCHAPNTVFTSLIDLLKKHQLSMLLKLNCGGIAVLSPWAGGVGSLAVVSSTGLATPPVNVKPNDSPLKTKHPSVLKFVTQAVEKCLKSAPPHEGREHGVAMKRFAAHQTERWFKPLLACESAVSHVSSKKYTKPERLAMQERLQKKYRPQIPRPLATGEIDKIDLVDITQPPTDPEPSGNNKTNMSRAQKLVKKSHIVTAQQKVKEQIAEEEERVQATERRAALASEQARRSQALESHVLNTVADPQNTEELVQSLILLRDRHDEETDPYTTAQTIINLALVHVKNIGSVAIEDELGKIIGDGVLQSASDINATCPAESRLNQYKLQTLLHLELLWLLGYSSSCMLDEEEKDSRGEHLREHHIGEAVKHLRAISLNHNPTTMANFLKETILENYGETLGEVLVELFEELNQPLPDALRMLTEDASPLSDAKPPSVRSLMSISGPESNGSIDNPEERRMSRHPSLIEATKHRLVVPMANRSLKRSDSDQTKNTSNKENADHEIMKVRRNLFDLSGGHGSRSKLQRSHTSDCVPVKELRRSPRKKQKQSSETSPSKTRGGHKTPNKGIASTSKGLSTPKLRKRGVLAPETPGNKIGLTIFNKKRICKSTGTTIISESPDVKRICRTTPRRLRASLTVSRRNSFYSGARSRNWERAKTQLLADRIRGKSSQLNIDQNGKSSQGSLEQKSLQNVSTNYLFTELLSESQARLCNDDVGDTPKKVLNFGLDDSGEGKKHSQALIHQNCDSVSADTDLEDSPFKNTRLSEQMKVERSLSFDRPSITPTKNARRVLSLSTPSKRTRAYVTSSDASARKKTESPEKTSKQGIMPSCPSTPKHFRSVYKEDALSELTPSKRVQFSLKCTPSKEVPVGNPFQSPMGKNSSLLGTPITPKSILKTPKKTPNKTPSKRIFFSPDLFSTEKIRPRSPAKTPLRKPTRDNRQKHDNESDKNISNGSSFSGFSDTNVDVRQTTPVKVENIAWYDEGEMELVSPLKRDQDSSKASLILHNTPKKKLLARNLLDFESCQQNEKETKKEEDEDIAENSVNLDEDIKPSMILPQMNPDDIELLNSLMFGDDIDQNLNISDEVLCNNVDSASNDYIMKKDIFSSTLNSQEETFDNDNSDSLISLPEKQESPDKQDEFFTATLKAHISLSESVEISPTSIDKIPVPSFNELLNEHMSCNVEELDLVTTAETFGNNCEDENVDMEIQPFSPSTVDSPSEHRILTKEDYIDIDVCYSPSDSPEIILDPKFLSSLGVVAESEFESDSNLANVDSYGKRVCKNDNLLKRRKSPGKSKKLPSRKSCKRKQHSDEDDEEVIIDNQKLNLDSKTPANDEREVMQLSDDDEANVSGSAPGSFQSKETDDKTPVITNNEEGEVLQSSDNNETSADTSTPGSFHSQETEEQGGEKAQDGKKRRKLSSNVTELAKVDDSSNYHEQLNKEEAEPNGKGHREDDHELLNQEEAKQEEIGHQEENHELVSQDEAEQNGKIHLEETRELVSNHEYVEQDTKRYMNQSFDCTETYQNDCNKETRLQEEQGDSEKGSIPEKSNRRKSNDEYPPSMLHHKASPRRKSCKKKIRFNEDDTELEMKSRTRRSVGRKCKGAVKYSSDNSESEENENISSMFQNEIVQPQVNQEKSVTNVEIVLTEPKSNPSMFSHGEAQQCEAQALETMQDNFVEGLKTRSLRRQRVSNYTSSTPLNMQDHKRKLSSSEKSETDNRENKRLKVRKCTKSKSQMKRRSERMSKAKLTNLKEPSSDDESFNMYQDVNPCFSRKRIFDEDSDFESPDKCNVKKKSRKLPLKNVENICEKVAPVNSSIADDEDLHTTLEKHTSTTPTRRENLKTVGTFLSPIHKIETESRRETRQSQMSSDWKETELRPDLVEESNDPSSNSERKSGTSMILLDSETVRKRKRQGGKPCVRKRKRKGVKLKLTKSGENYEVSRVDLSIESSDRNSSTADSLMMNSEDSMYKSPGSNVKQQSPSKKKKKNDNQLIITPLRFTRHMSKDLSVSPELFSQLIALSPKKASPPRESETHESVSSPKFVSCEIRKRKKNLMRQMKRNPPKKQTSVADTCSSISSSDCPQNNIMESEWTVQSLPGSPTMKTFKRKQKGRMSKHSSTRVDLSPISSDHSLIKPSFSSLMHLTVSPIVNKVKSAETKLKQMSETSTKPKSLRRLYKKSMD